MRKRKSTGGRIATLYAVVALAVLSLAFLCAGCRASKEVARSHTATIQQGVKLERDSIRLPYLRHTERWYLPTGALEREEVREQAELMRVRELVRDTLYIVQRDTIREVTTPPPTAATLPSRINATLWGVAIGATLVALIIGVIKLRRLL